MHQILATLALILSYILIVLPTFTINDDIETSFLLY